MYKPDLIIMDYLNPGLYGAVICRQLKTTVDTKHIPIIMFSVHPIAEDAARKTGAEDFINKPFSINELLESGHMHMK